MSSPFSEVETVDCPLPAARDFGALPQLKWLPVASLKIDSGYQRSIMAKGRANIALIVAEFSWSRFSPLVVRPIVDGLYAIIDGQHRTAAAKRLGIADVPCQIVAVKPAEAAKIFTAINGNVTPMTPQYLYKAALASGEPWALQIERIAARAKVDVLRYPVPISKQKPRQTMMIGTLRNRLARYGEDLVGLALEGMMAAPGADVPGFARALALDAAIARVHATPDALKDRAATIKALARLNYATLSRAVVSLPSIARDQHTRPAAAPPPLTIVNSTQRAKVLDLFSRRYKPSQIAAVMKLPHADVQRIIDGEAK